MNEELLALYNQSFVKLKTLSIFDNVPEYDAKTCDLCLYGINFGNMKYDSLPNLDDTDKYIIHQISGILSLVLYYDDNTNVYGPLITFKDGRRSLDICDLNPELIVALYENAENLFQQPIILSRIFDVIWISKQLKDKRNYITGEKACNCYKILFESALDARNYHFAQNILSRLHNLVLQLGKSFKGRNNHFNSLLPLLDITTTSENIFFLHTVWEFILNINWKENNNDIYQKIISQIQSYLPKEQNLCWVEKCSYLLCKIYHKLKDNTQCQNILENLAQKYIDQAEVDNHPIKKIHLLSQAIETLRRINKNPCKQKIKELCNQIQELQIQNDNYFKTVTAEVDITKEVTDLLKGYQNASFQDCILGLWLSKKYLPTQQQIKNEIADNKPTLTDFVSTSFLNHLGQTVSVANDYKEYTHKQLSRNLVYGMRIKPLLELINERFFYSKNSFSDIVLYNPMVPEGYEDIYAKGIYYFLKCQYLEAATNITTPDEKFLEGIIVTPKSLRELFLDKIPTPS